MITYRILHPDPTTPDFIIDDLVQRGISSLSEIGFGLDRVTNPSAADIQVDNTEGQFEPGRGFFQDEITGYTVFIQREGLTPFVGLVDDIEYKGSSATLKVRSVLGQIIQANIPQEDRPDIVLSGTPSFVMKTVIIDELNLPNLFVDSLAFDNLSVAEDERNIEISVNIPASEKVPFSSFVQEFYKVTGLYLYSENGILKPVRLGGFTNPDGVDFVFGEDFVISDSVTRRRPLLWQKTRVVVPGPSGQLARNMSDEYQEGPSLLAKFREKTLESDGLQGKIKHATVESGVEAMNDILGWRGFPRYELRFQADLINENNAGQVESLSLFSRVRVEYATGSINGIIVEKKLQESRAELTLYSIKDPEISHPGLCLLPIAINKHGVVVFAGKFDYEVEYFLEGDSPSTVTLSQTDFFKVIDNRSQRVLYFRVLESATCKNTGWYCIEHEGGDGCFYVDINQVGQEICD